MKRLLGLIDMLDEFFDATVELEQLFLVVAFILERDLNPAIQKCQFAEPVGEDVVLVLDDRKNFAVRLECDLRAGPLGFADDFQLRRRFATLEPHVIDLAVAFHLGFEPLTERIDAGHTHAVQTAGNCVGFFIELAAGMEHGEHDFDRRLLFRLVHVHRNAAPVVNNRNRVVHVNDDFHVVTETSQSFVDRVIDHFIDEMMQTALAGVANVHRRPFADRFNAFKLLNLVRVVIGRLPRRSR